MLPVIDSRMRPCSPTKDKATTWSEPELSITRCSGSREYISLVPSRRPMANRRPFGDQATTLTGDCPGMVCSTWSSATLCTRTGPSASPISSVVPSGEMAMCDRPFPGRARDAGPMNCARFRSMTTPAGCRTAGSVNRVNMTAARSPAVLNPAPASSVHSESESSRASPGMGKDWGPTQR